MLRWHESFDPAEYEAVAEQIRELEPLIRAHADAADRNCRLSSEVAEALAEAGLHRLAAPAHVGGTESHPFTQILAIEQVSAIDGAAGWNLMIGIESLGILAATLAETEARQLLARPDTIVSGALNPKGVAEPVSGGYRVSGQWPFASGCHNSHWFWGQCIVERGGERLRDPEGRVQLVEVVVPREQYEIVETWDVAGLRGSGSHDIRIDGRFVPQVWTTQVTRERLRAEGPLFHMPIYARLAYNKVGVATGIARHAVDAFCEHARQKTPRASTQPLAERSDAQLAVARAEAALRAARAFVFEAVGDVYETVRRAQRPTLEQRALVQLACSHAASEAVHAVAAVHESAGSTANFRGTPLERCFRDVQVVRQHIMVSSQWMAAAGRVLLGQPSQSFLF